MIFDVYWIALNIELFSVFCSIIFLIVSNQNTKIR